MDPDEYVRLEVADSSSGDEVVLIGYFMLVPHDDESIYRVVDDYLFCLSPHKVTFRSEEYHVLCSRYTLPLTRVGRTFRMAFLEASLKAPSLAHEHRLEVETLLEALEGHTDRSEDEKRESGVGKEVNLEDTRGYWGHLAGR